MNEDKKSIILLPDGEPAPAEMVERKSSKPKWSFREEPGMCFANLEGELVALNAEARKALRRTTFDELMGMPKRSYTQKDYEEIEESFVRREVEIGR